MESHGYLDNKTLLRMVDAGAKEGLVSAESARHFIVHSFSFDQHHKPEDNVQLLHIVDPRRQGGPGGC